MKLRKWLIKKLAGDLPVIMNVTIKISEPIAGSKPDGLIHNSNITFSGGNN